MLRSVPRLRLYLVRHGQVAANRELRYVGERDEELTPEGRSQAEALARWLAELPIRRVVTSPLRRASQTADRIAAAARVPLRADPRLREQSFGDWEGMSRSEVMARSEADRERLQAWESDPGVAPPGGESLTAVGDRVLDLVTELARGDDATVALVSHVGPIKALLAAALGLRVDQVRRLFLDPASISVVDWGEPSLVRLCNSHAHLGWTRARWMRS